TADGVIAGDRAVRTPAGAKRIIRVHAVAADISVDRSNLICGDRASSEAARPTSGRRIGNYLLPLLSRVDACVYIDNEVAEIQTLGSLRKAGIDAAVKGVQPVFAGEYYQRRGGLHGV